MEGTEPYPQWQAHVGHEVPADPVKQPARDGAIGLDRNVGQATDRDGTVYALPDTERLDAQCPRLVGDLGRQQGLGSQGPLSTVEPGTARERATRAAAPPAAAPARPCHPPGPPHAGGHGACRGSGGPEHEGQDGLRQGHRGGTRPEREAEGRTAPQPSGGRWERPGTEAGPQGRGAGQGEPGACVADVQPVRPRPQDPPTVTDNVQGPAGSRPIPTTVEVICIPARTGLSYASVPAHGTGAAARPGGNAVGDPRVP